MQVLSYLHPELRPCEHSLTYPPDQVLLGGRVKHIRYLEVGINTEAVFRSSRGGGASCGTVWFMSLRSRLHMGVLRQFYTEVETNFLFFFHISTALSIHSKTTCSPMIITVQHDFMYSLFVLLPAAPPAVKSLLSLLTTYIMASWGVRVSGVRVPVLHRPL